MRCSQIRKHKFNDKILCECAVDNFKSDDVFDFTVTHMPKSLHTDADTQTKNKKGFQNPCAADNFKSDNVFDFTVTYMPKSLHTDADTQTKTKKGFQNPTQQKHKNVKLTKACTRMAQVPYVGWSDS